MDFSAMFNTWVKVLTKPSEETFQQEVDNPQAGLGTALLWILMAAIATGAVSFLSVAASMGQMGQMQEMFRSDPDIPPEMAEMFGAFFSTGSLMGLIVAGIVLTPILWLLGSGIYYGIGMLLGGQGDFGRYAYLLASFQAPLTIGNALVSLVPLLGACVSLAIAGYQVFLTYLATRAGLNLSPGRALTVALAPLIFTVLLAVCFVIFLSSIIFAAGSSTSP